MVGEQRDKSLFYAKSAITQQLSSTILDNKWRVRDYDVIKKMGFWINEYLVNGVDNNNGLVNLTKLKFMVEKDLPVYSLDEVKNANSP